MNPIRTAVVWTVVLGLLTVAAGRQIAMRVEVASMEADSGENLTTVSIFVAPEDRGVLGGDVMVWAELSRNEERVARKGWAIKIDDPGAPIRIEAEWPAGEYVLRVDVEGAQGRSYGVWWGDVDLNASAPAPAPAPVPAPDEPDASVSASDSGSVSVSVSDQPQRSAEAAWTDTAAPAETAAVAETAAETTAETVAASGTASVPEVKPAEVDSGRENQGASAQPPPETPAETVAEAALVPAPMPVATPPPESVSPVEPVTVLKEPVAGWGSSNREFGELTVSVTRNGEPVPGLTSADLEIRLGKDEIPVIEVGGADVAPVLLGIAVDLAPESAHDLPWIGRMVAELAQRAAGDRGLAFATTTDGANTGWGIDTERAAEHVVACEPRAETGVAELVERALAAFEGHRGRAALLVVTDGRGSRRRDGVRDALRAAETSGVPVFIIGIWHDRFGQGVRKDLRRIAVGSGGGSFYLQGPGQLDDVTQRFGGVLDGMYAVRVDAPVGTLGVEVIAGDASVRASTAVR